MSFAMRPGAAASGGRISEAERAVRIDRPPPTGWPRSTIGMT